MLHLFLFLIVRAFPDGDFAENNNDSPNTVIPTTVTPITVNPTTITPTTMTPSLPQFSMFAEMSGMTLDNHYSICLAFALAFDGTVADCSLEHNSLDPSLEMHIYVPDLIAADATFASREDFEASVNVNLPPGVEINRMYTTPDKDKVWVTRKDTYWFRLDSINGEIPLDVANAATAPPFSNLENARDFDMSVDYGGYGLWPSEAKIVYTYEYLYSGRNFPDDNDVEAGHPEHVCGLRKLMAESHHDSDIFGVKATRGIKFTGVGIDFNCTSLWVNSIVNAYGHVQCGSPSSQMTSQTIAYIVGFTIAGFFLLVITIICVWWYCKKRRVILKSTDAANPLNSIDYAAGSWRAAEEKC